MIKLTKITRNDNIISCQAFVEDCDTCFTISLNETTSELEDYRLPQGYEWCASHIAHAKRYLKTLIGKSIISDEHTIMWY